MHLLYVLKLVEDQFLDSIGFNLSYLEIIFHSFLYSAFVVFIAAFVFFVFLFGFLPLDLVLSCLVPILFSYSRLFVIIFISASYFTHIRNFDPYRSEFYFRYLTLFSLTKFIIVSHMSYICTFHV